MGNTSPTKKNPKNNTPPPQQNSSQIPIEVSLSSILCKYCQKNPIPNKLIRSHLYYCIPCYLVKKKFKYEHDILHKGESHIVEIIKDKLYLGNNEGAKNKTQLNNLNVDSILICGYFLNEFYPGEFTYKTLEFEDNEYELITFAMVKAIEFIEENNVVYVHCRKGVSRSSSAVIAYIMYNEKKTYNDAYNFVKEKKSDISPNENFVKQLIKLEDIFRACNYDLYLIKNFVINFAGKNDDIKQNKEEIEDFDKEDENEDY